MLPWGPPSPGSVVESVTTRFWYAGLRPGWPGWDGRMAALSRLESLDLMARSITMPLPQTPWMELGSGENTCTVAAVAAVEDVVLDAAFFFEPPDEQAAKIRAAATVSTMNRFMGLEPYL